MLAGAAKTTGKSKEFKQATRTDSSKCGDENGKGTRTQQSFAPNPPHNGRWRQKARRRQRDKEGRRAQTTNDDRKSKTSDASRQDNDRDQDDEGQELNNEDCHKNRTQSACT